MTVLVSLILSPRIVKQSLYRYQDTTQLNLFAGRVWSNTTDSHQPQDDDAVCISALFIQMIPNKYYTKYFSHHAKVIRTLHVLWAIVLA